MFCIVSNKSLKTLKLNMADIEAFNYFSLQMNRLSMPIFID